MDNVDDMTLWMIGNFLKMEMYDDMAANRDSLQYLPPAMLERGRAGFADLLKAHGLSVREYGELTAGVHFVNSATLYEYLEKVYAYFFENAKEEPWPDSDPSSPNYAAWLAGKTSV